MNRQELEVQLKEVIRQFQDTLRLSQELSERVRLLTTTCREASDRLDGLKSAFDEDQPERVASLETPVAPSQEPISRGEGSPTPRCIRN